MGGLMDYKARFYFPLLGRFIQPDTITPGEPIVVQKITVSEGCDNKSKKKCSGKGNDSAKKDLKTTAQIGTESSTQVPINLDGNQYTTRAREQRCTQQ